MPWSLAGPEIALSPTFTPEDHVSTCLEVQLQHQQNLLYRHRFHLSGCNVSIHCATLTLIQFACCLSKSLDSASIYTQRLYNPFKKRSITFRFLTIFCQNTSTNIGSAISEQSLQTGWESWERQIRSNPAHNTLKVTYYTTRCECDQQLQAVLKICVF